MVAVDLEVRASNDPALKLYRGMGFSLVGRRDGYYRNPTEDAVLLTRSLA
jgi:ribosomal-protein-alanine N-acetyltransferase